MSLLLAYYHSHLGNEYFNKRNQTMFFLSATIVGDIIIKSPYERRQSLPTRAEVIIVFANTSY